MGKDIQNNQIRPVIFISCEVDNPLKPSFHKRHKHNSSYFTVKTASTQASSQA